MKIDKLVNNISKRIERFDPPDGDDSNYYWKGKRIIPLERWTKLKGTSDEWQQYFPDDFHEFRTFIPESELNSETIKKWNSDYLELMEYRKNQNYGRTKCFHCLLSPDGNDPIFIGINRLAAKGLEIHGNNDDTIQYPCSVANRFDCPYENENENESDGRHSRYANTTFDVNDLFNLQKMAFAVEIALAIARKDTSKIKLKSKQELYHALTDRETLYKILEQAHGYVLADKDTFDLTSKHDQDLCEQYQKNKGRIVDYFMNVKDKVKMEELRFY